MILTQITQNTWELTNDGAVLASDDYIDAMSFVARAFPGRPCTLDVQSYARSLESLADLVGIAA